jgi:hypothetical protein
MIERKANGLGYFITKEGIDVACKSVLNSKRNAEFLGWNGFQISKAIEIVFEIQLPWECECNGFHDDRCYKMP